MSAHPRVLFRPTLVLAAATALLSCPLSGTGDTNVDTTPPADAPRILKPLGDSCTGACLRPTFAWTAVADAAEYTFVATGYNGTGSPHVETVVPGESFTPTRDMLGSYTFTVAAIDAAGNVGPASAPRTVHVGRMDQDCDARFSGYSDVIVGAPYGGPGGEAYFFHGGETMDPTADAILAASSFGRFGCSVAWAGDVNGDGYADVIVGAEYNDSGGTNCGTAYVFYGGAQMDSTADVTLTGPGEHAQFGCAAAGAGDVNADGYADVIVGARYDPATGWEGGGAFIYRGGPHMDAVADVSLTVQTGDRFGWSVD